MFIYEFKALIILNFLILTKSHCHRDLFPLEREGDEEEEMALKFMFERRTLTDLELTLLLKKLSKATFTSNLRSNVWRKILNSDVATNLSIPQWISLQSVIPFIPPEILLTVNFTEDMIQFFGQFEMKEDQLSVIAEVVSNKWGEKMYFNESKILKMGNIFCGLSKNEMDKIHFLTLRRLLKKNFFNRVKGCNIEKLSLLSSKVQSYTVLGPPRTWQREDILFLGILLGGLNVHQIREIRSDYFDVFTPDLIRGISVDNLQKLRIEQLRMLPNAALLTWRRMTMNLTPLYSKTSRLTSSSAPCAYALLIIHNLRN